MNCIAKITTFAFCLVLLMSCDETNGHHYPRTVSLVDGFLNPNTAHEVNVNNFEQFPERIQNLAEDYFINRIGETLYGGSKFTHGYIASNKPIDNNKDISIRNIVLYGKEASEGNSESNQKWNYPVYSIGFDFSDPKKGIEKYDLRLMLDTNGNVLQHIAFPKVDSSVGKLNLISLDSVHRILRSKRISGKKLELSLQFSRRSNILYYNARTLIRKGSIAGPSCFPEYKHHFSMNAITGELFEYSDTKPSSY